MRYALEIKYDGTRYNGWQAQPGTLTVQGIMDAALSTLHNTAIESTGCGRTDSGVHASQFFLHFDSQCPLPVNFTYRLNRLLPPDISVKAIYSTTENFHARYDAVYRAYNYFCHYNKSPFLAPYSLHIRRNLLDIEKMRYCFEMLKDYQDFRAFCKTGSAQNHYHCDLYETRMIEDVYAGRLQFHIAANRFLRGMIRRVVGTLLMVGQHKISHEEFTKNMEIHSYFKLNVSVPPHGLFLSEVRYPPGLLTLHIED